MPLPSFSVVYFSGIELHELFCLFLRLILCSDTCANFMGSRARLSDFTFTFHFHALEKETATHSSILAWRIPGTEEPSGLPSMGSHRVGHD